MGLPLRKFINCQGDNKKYKIACYGNYNCGILMQSRWAGQLLESENSTELQRMRRPWQVERRRKEMTGCVAPARRPGYWALS